MQDASDSKGTAPRENQFHADLARRIIELVRERDVPAGFQLKEQWLCDALGVSRSPVRAALRLLDRHGVVRLVPNQGCFLARAATDLDDEEFGLPPTEEERLYKVVSRDRSANRLGQQINVTELTRRYETSRSLVERVLARLADDGLVEREAGRGWRFLPTVDNPQVYRESYRFRLTVEPMAILDPGFRPDPKRLQELRQSHLELIEELSDRMPSRRVVEADAAFHETLGEWSNNRFVMQAIQQQTRLRRLMEFQYSTVDPDRMRESCREHLAILDAVEAGDQSTAAEMMRRHICVARDLFPDFIEHG